MVELLGTYLEMKTPPPGNGPASRSGLAVEFERPSEADYLVLYRAVGEPVQWDERTRMPPGALAAFLESPATNIFVLREVGRAIGLCEFSKVDEDAVELTNFGIVHAAYGRGLGPDLLDRALRACWKTNPGKICLRTDTNDHPKALGIYERAGFIQTKRKMESFPD